MLQNVLMMFIAITMVVREIVRVVVSVAALMHVQINVRGLVQAPVREDMKINTH